MTVRDVLEHRGTLSDLLRHRLGEPVRAVVVEQSRRLVPVPRLGGGHDRDVLSRTALIVGVVTGTPLISARSLVDLRVTPPAAVDGLLQELGGIGALLDALSVRSDRRILRWWTDDGVGREYVIDIDGRPAIVIVEDFLPALAERLEPARGGAV